MQLNAVDQAFHDTYKQLLAEGHLKESRTGVDILMLPAMTMKFDLSDGDLPWPTTRGLRHRQSSEEMEWFVSGNSSIKFLRDRNNGIWDDWFIKGTDEYDETKPPVSLKKRLTRVSNKNQLVWDAICAAIDNNPVTGSEDLVDELVQIWVKTQFVKMVLPHRLRMQIIAILDTYGIPSYPLADADIGPGAYGPQWRNLKDTQLISEHLWKEYEAQGYEWVTIVPSGKYYDQLVVTRTVDQLANVIEQLKTNPDDRRMLVVAWNPGLVWRSALPPCHLYFQFMTTCRPGQDVFDDLIGKDKWKAFAGNCYEDQGIALDEETFVNRFNNDLGFRSYTECHLKWDFYGIPTRDLHCLLVMRSSDTPLGTPFNVAQYALLTHVIANVCGMQAKSLTWVGGDAHIYVNQVEGIQEQLSRNSHPESNPRISFKRKFKSIDEFTLDDIEFAGYEHRGFIDIPVAV